jgi:zinc transport system substrate-binding protein
MRELTKGDDSGALDITYVINTAVDLHSYAPTIRDMARMQESDIFIIIGGHSDAWAQRLVLDATRISLLRALGEHRLIIDDAVYCTECDEIHDVYHHADEHIWLSIPLVKQVCTILLAVLVEANPDMKDLYLNNYARYIDELNQLHDEFTMVTYDYPKMVFADRFPIRYFVRDYEIDYIAAFHGCSAETEVSISTVAMLVEEINTFNADTVFITETSDGAIARTVISNSRDKNQTIKVFNTMKSVTTGADVTYLDIMRSNLEMLRRENTNAIN